MSLAGTGGKGEESDIKIIKHSAAFRWPMAAPVVTSYTVGFLRLFDPFLADFSGSLLCGEGVESCEFPTFHNVDCAKPDHLRTQPLSRFVKVSWCESPDSTLPLWIVPFHSPGGGMSRRYRTADDVGVVGHTQKTQTPMSSAE